MNPPSQALMIGHRSPFVILSTKQDRENQTALRMNFQPIGFKDFDLSEYLFRSLQMATCTDFANSGEIFICYFSIKKPVLLKVISSLLSLL